MDIKTRRDASRGRKSKAGGEKIKSDSRIYTPVGKHIKVFVHTSNNVVKLQTQLNKTFSLLIQGLCGSVITKII